MLEKNQQQSFEYANNIINTVRESLIVLDSDLRVVTVSRSFYNFFKVKEEDTIGRLIYELGNHQWDIPKLRELLEEILPQKSPLEDYEVEHDFTTIGRRIMLLNARQIEQVSGREKIILLAIEDITERRTVEDGLEKTRKELAVIKKAADVASEFAQSIINTVREPLLALDQDLRVVAVSRSFYNFFKVKPEETVGQLIYNLGDHQWDIPKLRELLETILPQKTTFDDYEVEHDFATIGRRIMLLNARQIEQASGKEKIILLAIEDITERREVEKIKQQLKENEQLKLFRALIENSPDAIEIIDPVSMRYLDINEAGCKVLGYTKEEMLSMSVFDIDTALDVDTNKEIQKQLHQNAKMQITGKHRKKDGTTFPVEINIVLVEYEKPYLLCVVRDISERKEMEKELKFKEEMMLAQSKQAAMGDMLAMIAHQWKQPLAVINMEANTLRASIELEEEITKDYLIEYAKNLSTQIQNLAQTIDDFRNFFKPEQKREQIKIEDALTGTFKIIGSSLKNDNITVNIQNTSKSTLSINKSSLIQVLLNIIGNAKEVLLEKEVAKPSINITVTETKEAITLSICDNGGGISADIINKLGQPYFTTKQKLNGTGLGVYISKTILEKHLGGTLSWHNEKEGACFVMTLKR